MINAEQMKQLMQNPIGAALTKGFSLPPDMHFNGPKDIVMYLVNTGQVDQETLNQAQNLANQFGYKV